MFVNWDPEFLSINTSAIDEQQLELNHILQQTDKIVFFLKAGPLTEDKKYKEYMECIES